MSEGLKHSNLDPVEAIITRHSIKGKGSLEYPDLAEPEGLELAKKRTLEIKELIDNSPKDAIIFIGGASDYPRTKSTAEVYGDEINKLCQNDPNIIVLTRNQDDSPFDPENGYTSITENIKEIVKNNPEKKVVISFPMFIKQFAFSYEYAPDKYRWADKKGNLTPFTEKLVEADEKLAEQGRKDGGLILWIESQGKIGDIEGPSPKQVAEEYIEGLIRLQNFAKEYINERPLIVGGVGHSWDLDALAIYLGNGGIVDLDGYKKVANEEMIKETELFKFIIDKNQVKIYYKGQDFETVIE
jgi:hypothetical protein